ncbi:MAG: CehA/McbA family metallohydrolase [Chloroflexota bacterium]
MITELSGTLDHSHNKLHIPHTFELPEDATKLSIHFDYSPLIGEGADYSNQLSFSLFDPEKSRGTRHNSKEQQAIITDLTASPGFTPGSLLGGTWTLFVDTHRIMPPTPVEYQFTIEIETDGVVDETEALLKGSTASRGPGWYRGDLHGHTLHSDGSWDVADFITYARENHYDFVTLTDHNTISALAEWDSHCNDKLLTMGGMELTTYYGHALALGTRDWWEWRIAFGETMSNLAQQITDAGALFVIAHPRDQGDPACTGCRWEYEEMMPGVARIVEVWNGSWTKFNEDSLSLAYEWLNAGHRMAFTYGSDIHGRPSRPKLSHPLNVVYADDLTEAAILEGVRQGHNYISTGPVLTLTAISGEKTYMMGDMVPSNASTAEPVQMNFRWSNCPPGATAKVIRNGAPAFDCDANGEGEHRLKANEDASWYLVEIRDPQGDLLAITNPLFVKNDLCP